MNRAHWKLILLLGTTLVIMSCGTKRYVEPERCEDLSTVFFTELDSQTWSNAERNAVTRFESIGGDWLVTLDCPGEPDKEAQLVIDYAFRTNVEMYEDAEEAACDAFGKAIFEARISRSGDVDLDGTTFTMTADLPMPGSRDGFLLNARSREMVSQYKDTASFSLQIIIDESGAKMAIKQVAMVPDVSESSTTIIVTQRDACTLTNWVAQ